MRRISNAIQSSTGQDVTVALLAWVAGSVDAISYLGLGHVFTANMTGNTVLLGLALGQGQGLAALRSLVALGGFGLGVAIGALIVERKRSPATWSPAVTWAVLAEGAVLAIFTFAWHFPMFPGGKGVIHALITLSSIAMGIQSAAVRRLGLPGIATTYVTGTLTSLVSGLVGRPRAAGPRPSPAKATDGAMHWERSVKLQATVFLAYGLAAATSGVMQARLRPAVTLSPLAAMALVVVSAFVHQRRREHLPES